MFCDLIISSCYRVTILLYYHLIFWSYQACLLYCHIILSSHYIILSYFDDIIILSCYHIIIFLSYQLISSAYHIILSYCFMILSYHRIIASTSYYHIILSYRHIVIYAYRVTAIAWMFKNICGKPFKNALVFEKYITNYYVFRAKHRHTFICKRFFRQTVKSLQFYTITTRRPETQKK